MKKVKVSFIGIFDMLKFKNLRKKRTEAISAGSVELLNINYNVNKVASALHPPVQNLVISEIYNETEDVKTFKLIPDQNTNTKKLANFKAGQYLTIRLNIGESLVSRPYTISSSPKMSRDGIYKITVKKIPGGFVSNYLVDKALVGDKIIAYGPSGDFTYSSIRDEKNIVALAGGCGLTTFFTMAQAIVDGDEDFNLTIFCCAKTEKELLFKEKLLELSSINNKIKVIFVLSEEKNPLYEHGFITKDLIDKYISNTFSIYICGPQGMYHYLDEELKKFNLPAKAIRKEIYMTKINTELNKAFKLTVYMSNKVTEIPCRSDETLSTALERAGISSPIKCRVGECGFCRSKLLSGQVKMASDKRRLADKKYNYIHPCCTYPVSDISLKIII